MNNASRRKQEFLGMPIGTAIHRLRKMVLLHLLQRLGEDICFRCDKQIAIPEDLSIEHKQDWLGIDPRLFWNLDNLAFSHRRCNSLAADHSVGARERGIATAQKTRKIGPVGTSWCSGCQQFLPLSDYHLNPSGRNGVHWYCRHCVKKRRGRKSSG
jgi:hypothetical protein